MDTDFTAKLVDVFPDGRALNIQEGALRMRYRTGFTTPTRMTPGEVYKVTVDMRAIGWYLPPGHRLRVQISSSNFPRLERNLNTGGNNFDEVKGVIAQNQLFRDAEHPSAVILPMPSGLENLLQEDQVEPAIELAADLPQAGGLLESQPLVETDRSGVVAVDSRDHAVLAERFRAPDQLDHQRLTDSPSRDDPCARGRSVRP